MAEENSPVLHGLVPWGLHPLPTFVKTELESRPKRYAGNDDPTKNISSIKSAWVRVCSNGVPTNKSHPASGSRSGFVFFGPNNDASNDSPANFGSTFGFGGNGSQVIGYSAVDGGFHYLSSRTFPHRPPPGIVSIDTEFYGAGSSFPGMCRKATIKWKCYSVEQLEYITPYLMSLRVSMVLEWGWNDYDPSALIDLADPDALLQLFKFPDVDESTTKTIFDRISTSKGNYDCHVGRIINYGYTVNSQGNYEGFTEVVNPTAMFEGNSIVNQAATNKEKESAKNFKDFIKNNFDCLAGCFNDADSTLLASVKDHVKSQVTSKFFSYISSDKNKDGFRLFRFTDDDKLNRHGKPSAKFWINFRMFESILNHYATINDTGKKSSPLFKFRLRDVIISGRPLIKAVTTKPSDMGVIIPNMFAPRLMKSSPSESPTSKSPNTYGSISKDPIYQQVDSDFASSAASIKKSLADQQLSDVVDDLQSVTHAVNSFPRFSRLPSDGSGSPRGSSPGYWGELGDIYISNELIKKAVESNDTFLRMLEYVLAEVAVAGTGIWEFRVIPNSLNGVTAIDTMYCPIYNSKQAEKLVNFTVGKTEGSAFTEHSMDIKMSEVIAMQALMNRQSSTDPKRVDMFVQDDRLYGTGGSYTMVDDSGVPPTDKELKEAAEKLKKEEEAKREKIRARASDEGFVVWHHSDGKNYYFNEKDAEFMRQMIQLKAETDPSATPVFPGTEFTFTMPGMAGFFFLSLFTLSGVPSPYSSENAIFQVSAVKNSIAGNNWKTSVTAQVRPLTTITT